MQVNEITVGSATMFVGLLHDVTQLLDALSLSASVLEEASDPMVLMDQHGTVHRWNACAAATFGYSREEAEGSNITIIMPEPFRCAQHACDDW